MNKRNKIKQTHRYRKQTVGAREGHWGMGGIGEGD